MFDSFHPHCFYGPVTQRESARPASEMAQVQFLSGPPFGRVVEKVYTPASEPGAARRAGSNPVLTTLSTQLPLLLIWQRACFARETAPFP
jgi:hypothetical protein